MPHPAAAKPRRHYFFISIYGSTEKPFFLIDRDGALVFLLDLEPQNGIGIALADKLDEAAAEPETAVFFLYIDILEPYARLSELGGIAFWQAFRSRISHRPTRKQSPPRMGCLRDTDLYRGGISPPSRC